MGEHFLISRTSGRSVKVKNLTDMRSNVQATVVCSSRNDCLATVEHTGTSYMVQCDAQTGAMSSMTLADFWVKEPRTPIPGKNVLYLPI